MLLDRSPEHLSRRSLLFPVSFQNSHSPKSNRLAVGGSVLLSGEFPLTRSPSPFLSKTAQASTSPGIFVALSTLASAWPGWTTCPSSCLHSTVCPHATLLFITCYWNDVLNLSASPTWLWVLWGHQWCLAHFCLLKVQQSIHKRHSHFTEVNWSIRNI